MTKYSNASPAAAQCGNGQCPSIDNRSSVGAPRTATGNYPTGAVIYRPLWRYRADRLQSSKTYLSRERIGRKRSIRRKTFSLSLRKLTTLKQEWLKEAEDLGYTFSDLCADVSVQRTSQFDFVKYGGTLIQAPFPESALNSYTFTWDLRKAIAPTATRLAAADAKSKIASYQDPLKEKATKLCVAYSGPLRSPVNVPSKFEAASCQKFAKDVGADHYALACVSDNGVLIGTPYPKDFDPDQKLKAGLDSCRW